MTRFGFARIPRPGELIFTGNMLLRWPRRRRTRGLLLGGTIAAVIVVMRHLSNASIVFQRSNEWVVDKMAVDQFALLHGCNFVDTTGPSDKVHPILDNQGTLKDKIIIDVGANDGINLAIPSRMHGARTIAFEPQLMLAKQIQLRTVDFLLARRVDAINSKRNAANNATPSEMQQTVQLMQFTPGKMPSKQQMHAVLELLTGSGGARGGLIVVNSAVSDVTAAMTLMVPDIEDSMSQNKMVSLTGENMPRANGGRKVVNGHAAAIKGDQVPVVPLDLLLPAADFPTLRVALFKVDAQGHELHVMRGAEQLLSRPGCVEVVQLEFCPKMMDNAMGTSNGWAGFKFLELMNSTGRRCFQVSKETHLPLLPKAQVPFASFVAAHFEGPCPVLGCATELICLPQASYKQAQKRILELAMCSDK